LIGVINVNKPKGVSSSNVVVKIKKILNIKKVGHMGTLDPLASGVLPICVGKATRLFDYFLKKQKTYIARFKFGEETSTLDLEGQVVKTSKNIPSKEDVISAIKSFEGDIIQTPPIFSSKKINGKKAYDLARTGKEVDLKPCPVTIYNYSLLNKIDEATYEFMITCSAGTYIRCLARDLGYKLNSCATMVSLTRIQSGPFKLETAIDYDKLSLETIKDNLISLNTVLADFESFDISKQDFQRLLNGLIVKVDKKPTELLVVYLNNVVVGIGEIDKNNNLKIKTYLFED